MLLSLELNYLYSNFQIIWLINSFVISTQINAPYIVDTIINTSFSSFCIISGLLCRHDKTHASLRPHTMVSL